MAIARFASSRLSKITSHTELKLGPYPKGDSCAWPWPTLLSTKKPRTILFPDSRQCVGIFCKTNFVLPIKQISLIRKSNNYHTRQINFFFSNLEVNYYFFPTLGIIQFSNSSFGALVCIFSSAGNQF